jgi:branched-chain amino acid transport system substrate-binding protein
MRPTTNRRLPLSLLLIACLFAAACGSHLSEAEVLRAGGVTERTPGSTGGPADGGADVGAADPGGAGAPVVTVPGAVAPGGTAAGGGVAPSTGGAGAAATPDAVSTPGETGPIVIGSVGDYSGPAGGAQKGIPVGVQVWAASVNAKGGLFGRPVQVIVVDDGGDPARYASAVRDLVENRHAVAFVGNGASLAMKGGRSYLESNGIPVIGSDCSVDDWFASAAYFPQCPTFADAVPAIMKAGARVTGKKRFGFVACTEASACTGQKPRLINGAKGAGVEIVYQADISLTQVDFTAECRNAQAARVEMLYVAAGPDALLRMARSCSRQGFRPTYVQASISVDGTSKDIDGIDQLVVSLPIFPFQGGTGPGVDAFAAAYKAYAPNVVIGPADSFGWAAAKLFELIATNAARATKSVTSKTLTAAGRKLSGETLGGLTVPLTFTSGKATPANCYFAVVATGRKWSTPLGSGAICD